MHDLESFVAVRLNSLHLLQNEFWRAHFAADFDCMVGAVCQRRSHWDLGFEDLLEGIIIIKDHVLNSVATGLDRHAVGFRGEAVHGCWFM